MSHYRGYFMQGEHIVAPANLDATDDAQAMLKAAELLSTSQFVRIEVWQETRVVGALSAPAPTPEYAGRSIGMFPMRLTMMHPTWSGSEVDKALLAA